MNRVFRSTCVSIPKIPDSAKYISGRLVSEGYFKRSNPTYLICRKTGYSVVIDAPGEPGKIIESLAGTTPKYILMTHNHIDHVGALSALKTEIGVPIAAHLLDADNLPAQADTLLSDGDTVSFGNIQLRVLHTPGHKPGSLCFLTDGYLISGDTLFPGGPGKTISPDAFRQIMTSITSRLLDLPPDIRIYPGHGEPAVLGQEKPAIIEFSSRTHPSNLCGDVLWASS